MTENFWVWRFSHGLVTWNDKYYFVPPSPKCRPAHTEVECTCSVAECTLHVNCKLNSAHAVYTDHAVYYTLQTAVYTASSTLHVHFSLGSVVAVYTAVHAACMQSTLQVTCSYTACTLHLGVGVYTPPRCGSVHCSSNDPHWLYSIAQLERKSLLLKYYQR